MIELFAKDPDQMLHAVIELFAKDPDQMLHAAASDLGLHCLPITCLGASSLQWVKSYRGWG